MNSLKIFDLAIQYSVVGDLQLSFSMHYIHIIHIEFLRNYKSKKPELIIETFGVLSDNQKKQYLSSSNS